LLNGGKSNLPDEIKTAIVCEKMSWTYTEYEEQPEWFISSLLMKWSIENEHQKKNTK
jgi:hypothetical protein